MLAAMTSARRRASEVFTVPARGDLAMLDVDLDLGRVVRQLGGEPVGHVSLDALVLALVMAAHSLR
jgi:hypothetical protein